VIIGKMDKLPELHTIPIAGPIATKLIGAEIY